MSVCWVLSTLNHLTFKIANHSVALFNTFSTSEDRAAGYCISDVYVALFNTFSTSEDRAAGYCISDVYDTLGWSVYLQLFYSEN